MIHAFFTVRNIWCNPRGGESGYLYASSRNRKICNRPWNLKVSQNPCLADKFSSKTSERTAHTNQVVVPCADAFGPRAMVRKVVGPKMFVFLFVCLDHWSENTDRFFLPKKVFSFTLAEKVLVSSPSCTAGRFLPICLCRTSFINAYLFRVRRVREGSKIIGTQNRRQAKIEIFRPRPLPYLSRIVWTLTPPPPSDFLMIFLGNENHHIDNITHEHPKTKTFIRRYDFQQK